jgi:hypothetical protein
MGSGRCVLISFEGSHPQRIPLLAQLGRQSREIRLIIDPSCRPLAQASGKGKTNGLREVQIGSGGVVNSCRLEVLREPGGPTPSQSPARVAMAAAHKAMPPPSRV